jgi:hypothetical protein
MNVRPRERQDESSEHPAAVTLLWSRWPQTLAVKGLCNDDEGAIRSPGAAQQRSVIELLDHGCCISVQSIALGPIAISRYAGVAAGRGGPNVLPTVAEQAPTRRSDPETRTGPDMGNWLTDR